MALLMLQAVTSTILERRRGIFDAAERLDRSEVVEDEVRETGLSGRRRVGHGGPHADVFPVRRDRPAESIAHHLSAVLLWISGGHDSLAARLPRDRVGSGAIPASDDPEHGRKNSTLF